MSPVILANILSNQGVIVIESVLMIFVTFDDSCIMLAQVGFILWCGSFFLILFPVSLQMSIIFLMNN